MADILGTVSSAIAVAEVGLKVGGTLLKLRELWKEVQHVPQKIEDIMSQIDIYEPILADIERHLNAGPITSSESGTAALLNASIGTKASSYCREAFKDLQDLVEDLSRQITSTKRSKRGIGKLKVLLKKDDLNRFQTRLERAFWLLQLAHASQHSAKLDYLTTLVESQAPIMVRISQQFEITRTDERLGRNLAPSATTQKHGTTKSILRRPMSCPPIGPPTMIGRILARSSRNETHASKHGWILRFQPPKWLSQTVWDFCTQQACSGWQINLVIYNLVPWDSDVVQFALHDNWEGLVELFRKGHASPHDYSWQGSLMEVACMSGSISVIQGLLQAEQTQVCTTRFNCALILYWCWSLKPLTNNQIQTLLLNGFVDWVADDFVDVKHEDILRIYNALSLWGYCPPNESLLEKQIRSYLPYWNQYCRVDKVTMISPSVGWPAKTVRRLLDLDGPIQEADIILWKEDGLSLLHWSIMWFSGSSPSVSWCRQRKDWTEWLQLLTEIINATDNLHLMKTYFWQQSWSPLPEMNGPMTFFLCFFGVVDRCLINREIQSSMDVKLTVLLGVLESCHVDLEAYGRREFDIWEREYGAKHMKSISCVKFPDWNWTKSQYLGDGEWTNDLMVAIHYGPKQEDWCIEWDRYWDYAEVFWNMVENPLQVEVMPGSWVNDDLYRTKGPPQSSLSWEPWEALESLDSIPTTT